MNRKMALDTLIIIWMLIVLAAYIALVIVAKLKGMI